MEPKHLFTIKWTQTYPTYQMRPYLRQLREELEQAIEAQVERNHCPEAQAVIERIMKL